MTDTDQTLKIVYRADQLRRTVHHLHVIRETYWRLGNGTALTTWALADGSSTAPDPSYDRLIELEAWDLLGHTLN